MILTKKGIKDIFEVAITTLKNSSRKYKGVSTTLSLHQGSMNPYFFSLVMNEGATCFTLYYRNYSWSATWVQKIIKGVDNSYKIV